MKFTLIFIFIRLSLVCFGQDEIEKLGNAFEEDSIELLDEFLEGWYNEFKPYTRLNTLDAISQDVYKLYEVFFNPLDTNEFKFPRWALKENLAAEYIIVPYFVNVIIYDSDTVSFNRDFRSDYDAITSKRVYLDDFHPKLEFENKRVLSLAPKYEDILDHFLGNYLRFRSMYKINNRIPKSHEDIDRVVFLNKRLAITSSHWMDYWIIGTYPLLDLIEFNKNRTMACITFTSGFSGGDDTYVKRKVIFEGSNKENWVFLRTRWIWEE